MTALAVAPEPEYCNEDLWRDFRRELLAEGLRATTLAAYHDAFKSLWDWCERDLLSLAKTDIQDWIAALYGRGLSQSTANAYYRGASRFYGWAAAEALVAASPMAGMKPPHIDDIPVPIPPVADIRAVLKVCEADKSPAGLRDTAIIRIWCEAGSPRASEMAGALAAGYDAATDTLTVRGKGGKWRTFPLSARTARALARWMRARAQHPHAGERPELFLGGKGAMTRSGMYQLAERRCAQARVPRIHPHQFRHYATDAYLAAGGQEGDLARLNGWSKNSAPVMLARYGAAAADGRAAAAARGLSIGNQL